MPSARTSARLAPLAPKPRSDTPCDVGLAVWLPDLRRSEKPTTFRSLSSVASAPHCLQLVGTDDHCVRLCFQIVHTGWQNSGASSSYVETLLERGRNQRNRHVVLACLAKRLSQEQIQKR